ncbi:hypothetical protein BU24DRAFT_484443 [Aaosphaeria arxii CBS 175.79]|uniref:CENP-V/GFA domain-containing protein n=1 Tax=Aaosphaeria arxii CBS 175.79 TaxID=1450172 RepID=A0A6A5XIS4_9PLEO|nr:uncharacterized protein BU24DRAFT_484443 [Aaosphaeria arxii CBS 175.79]KAF2012727.1 hypothetical protein BU24DRAFT_484443 [Aaosphaeria arxii CBS 175.79]
MPSGQCMCGAIKLQVSGDPVAVGLCHCLDCRKTSGSTHATNWFVPEAMFSVEGNPKTFETTANSGSIVTSYFCETCGVTMYRAGTGMPGMMFVKAGVLDDPELINSFVPQGEIFVSRRAEWLSPISGASQKEEMI